MRSLIPQIQFFREVFSQEEMDTNYTRIVNEFLNNDHGNMDVSAFIKAHSLETILAWDDKRREKKVKDKNISENGCIALNDQTKKMISQKNGHYTVWDDLLYALLDDYCYYHNIDLNPPTKTKNPMK